MLPMKLTSTVGTVALVALTAPAVSADFNSYYDHVLRRDGSGGGHSHGGGGSSGGHGGSSGGHGGGGSNIQSTSSNYQAPASSYQAPSSGYQSPSSGYQSPSSGYDSNNQGYNQPSSGYGGGGGGDNSYGGGVTGSGYGNEPSFPDLTPIILGILVLTGLSLLFPSYVSLTSVKRKRRDADEEASGLLDVVERVNDIYGSVMESEECMERIACEVGGLAADVGLNQVTRMAEPFAPKKYSKYMKQFSKGKDCHKIKCGNLF